VPTNTLYYGGDLDVLRRRAEGLPAPDVYARLVPKLGWLQRALLRERSDRVAET